MTGTRPEPLRGTIAVDGDKSISHRALMIGALASGSSRIRGLNEGEDVACTRRCLESLGARFSIDPNDQVQVEGSAGRLTQPAETLDAGNSGTTARLLLGVCAGIRGTSDLTGDETLRRRPMLRVVEPLRAMGARVVGPTEGRLLPLTVSGGRLRGIRQELPMASAQVKSAILLAGLGAEGVTEVLEPSPSRDHTERMFRATGVELVEGRGEELRLEGGQVPDPFDLEVPGDISSAMFLVVGALLIPGSDLTICDVGLNPSRTGALEILQRMGAALSWEVEEERLGEPVGSIRARYGDLKGVEIGGQEIPRTIDELPILAVAASQAEGTTVIREAAELRVKESDRIDACTQMLRVLGGDVEELEDGLVIQGPTTLEGGVVDARGDHRMAMSAAIAGLVASGTVRVEGWDFVATSFPRFMELVGHAQSPRSEG